MTAGELCLLANQKLNSSEAIITAGPDERWNLSYQAVSARKPTEQDLVDKADLKAGDWLLDVKVIMIHEYFQNGLWVTPPKNPVNYRLARYMYSLSSNTFQELD